jgi:hypothetical protein
MYLIIDYRPLYLYIYRRRMNQNQPIAATACAKDQYLAHLREPDNAMEYKALLIAQNHLGSSFDLCRSNGFQAWLLKQKQPL